MEKSRLRELVRRGRLGLLAVAVILAGALGASAQSGPALSDGDARAIALRAVPGTVVQLEREVEDGRRIVEVHVRDSSGRVMGVEIDEATRAIVATEEEEDDEQEDRDEEVDEAAPGRR